MIKENKVTVPEYFFFLKNKSLQELEREINNCIASGFMPMGTFQILPEMQKAPTLQTGPSTPQPGFIPVYCQAMIRLPGRMMEGEGE